MKKFPVHKLKPILRLSTFEQYEPSKMICPVCQKESNLDKEANFCSRCGTEFDWEDKDEIL
jgi:predicted amidophosphoribosyltransferase